MTTPSFTELKTTWSRRTAPTNELNGVGIRLLADGKPVTAAAFAAATGMDVDDATSYIESAKRYGVEVEDGAIVGTALTLRPTQHRFRVRGNDLYAWCGFDTLFLPIILGERAEVVSTCPVTGTEIRLTVEPDGTVSEAVPSTAAVAIVGEDVTSSCSATGPDSAICTQMPFFASHEAGERWLADHPGVAVIDLDQAKDVAHASVRDSCC